MIMVKLKEHTVLVPIRVVSLEVNTKRTRGDIFARK